MTTTANDRMAARRPSAWLAPVLAAGLLPAAAAAADFTGTPTFGCAPLEVDFTDTSTEPGIVSWSWEFGDGGTSTEQNPRHTYSQGGSFTVTLVVSDGTDQQFIETKTDFVTVLEPVAADFDALKRSGCAPLEVEFQDQSTGDEIDSYQWDFGDGGSSNASSPTHTYDAPGTYTVKLTVGNSCSSDVLSRSGFVTVTEDVTAEFDAESRAGCQPLTVEFRDRSSGAGIESWSWDFGDGGTSSAQNPTHRYDLPGAYDVSLTVGGTCGSDTETKTRYVTVGSAVTADFSGEPRAGCAPLAVEFTDASTGDGIDSWSWSFGDGGTSSQRNPNHTYTEPGVYTVRLTAGGACGEAVETKTAYVTVRAPVVARFSGTPRSGCPPLQVRFADESAGEGIDTWSWDFGDGGTSNQPSPTHRYDTPGTYNVSLTVRGTCDSDTETKTGYVTVGSGVDADFNATPRSGCAPLAVAFTDASTGDGIDTWSWNFGDGGTSSQKNPNHTYTAPGAYTVVLTATGTCGSDVRTKTAFITVEAPVSAAFSGTPLTGCAPLAVRFTDQSTGAIDSWTWDFGDGGTSNLKSPSHTYAEAGTYEVKLTVRNDCSTDTETRAAYVTVESTVDANFTGTPLTGCPPLTVQFTDTSTGDGLNSWSWDFGDGGTSTQRNPTHVYQTAGTFDVKLTAGSTCGSDTRTRVDYVTVSPATEARFTAAATASCPDVALQFTDQSVGTGIGGWRWDFGDGGTSTQRNPTHAYGEAGRYTVSLTVQGACGPDTETRANFITIGEAVTPNFSADRTSICAGDEVRFTDRSEGEGITSWSWNFGDGGTSTEQNPRHVYSQAEGPYTVSLTVRNACGPKTATRASFIDVNARVAANFTADKRSICTGEEIRFTDRSTGDPTAWTWNFGDGGTATAQNPRRTYERAGTHTVTLTARNACSEDTEVKTAFITVRATPAPPAGIDYPGTAFVQDDITVSWTRSPQADSYLVEGRIGTAGEWFPVCETEDTGLDAPFCPASLDEAGSWFFRVTAVNTCGRAAPLVGPVLEVSPRAVFADWPLDDRSAEDVASGNDGTQVGLIPPPVPDRFGASSAAIQFDGRGLFRGGGLPRWNGDYCFSLWMQPANPPATPPDEDVSFVELFVDRLAAGPRLAPLRFRWNAATLNLLVEHGTASIRFTNVGRGWHHVVASRVGGTLTAYLDGLAKPAAPDALDLPDGFVFGGPSGTGSRFQGRLDAVLYESRGRSAEEVLGLGLQGGASLFASAPRPPGDLAVMPGDAPEALELRLQMGVPNGAQGFALAGLHLLVQDVTPPPEPPDGGEEEPTSFDFLEEVKLFLRSTCEAGEAELQEIGVFQVTAERPREAELDLTFGSGNPFPLPAGGAVCLLVEATLSPLALPSDRTIQFALVTPGDLRVLGGDGQAAFVVGARPANGATALGDEIHIMNRPPQLRLALESSGDPEPQPGPIEAAELHRLFLQAGAAEGIRLEQITYRPVERTGLAGLTNARLFSDRGGVIEFAGDGVVDEAAKEIRFTGLSVEVGPGGALNLVLQADLSAPEPPAAAALPPGLPPALPLAILLAALLAPGAARALRLARDFGRRLRLAVAAVPACVLSLAITALAGCGPAIIGATIVAVAAGGGGGGGGGGGSSVITAFQVGVLDGHDLQAEGTTTEKPAVLEVEPGTSLVGPRFEITAR